ncbi:hypothetical protein B0H10DRAFT_1952006 [Mycena sp. CBHHK59/15]|nr:hypothetical protein B0H10DRAFT_1952006 [Mycena sp. CBHHK59/15]
MWRSAEQENSHRRPDCNTVQKKHHGGEKRERMQRREAGREVEGGGRERDENMYGKTDLKDTRCHVKDQDVPKPIAKDQRCFPQDQDTQRHNPKTKDAKDKCRDDARTTALAGHLQLELPHPRQEQGAKKKEMGSEDEHTTSPLDDLTECAEALQRRGHPSGMTVASPLLD